ncbi:hypothetical protein C8J56DRAFT_955033 [Mycena floridula]|nr:hypothetical protein C8J56DRAFT_955033 [Mycena floridula]
MFKNAATKIAHNSTIPSLAVGNKDLRPLQDLITAEKTVLLSLQKLSTDITKASDALRFWGVGEGEDLADILSASTAILGHFATALNQYASHESEIRDGMKSVRTREEALDELKRRRKVVSQKSEAAEKKLSKMGPEHKNLMAQTEILNQLREQNRSMDAEIIMEEASLGDFKRSSTRIWLGLKFAGLVECCEKGAISGEYGKLLVSEIPEDLTEPGMPRNMYLGHGKINSLSMEAQRLVDEVRLVTIQNTEPSAPSRAPRIPVPSEYDENRFNQGPLELQGSDRFNQGPSELEGHNRFNSGPSELEAPSPTYLAAPQGMGSGHFLDNSDIASVTGGASQQNGPTDDFAVGLGGKQDAPGGGRFATFPVKSNRGFALRDGPKSDGFESEKRWDDAPPYEGHIPLAGPPPGAAPPVRPETVYDDDAGLAYMQDDDDTSKHVRFGGVSDVNAELESRAAAPAKSPEEEERDLNAAAAREVSRELDALNFDRPPSAAASFSDPARGDEPHRLTIETPSREPSPLAPPVAPFSRRAVSPSIEGHVPSPTTYSPYSTNPYRQDSSSPVATDQPPVINVPNRMDHFASAPGPASPANSFSRSPLEQPRLGAGAFSKSSSSLNSQASPGGKISAAAFRRPVPRMGSSDTSERKRLPSSPHPGQGGPMPPSNLSKPEMPFGRERSNSYNSVHQNSVPQEPSRESGYGDYDYLSAYTNPDGDPGSPVKTDYGSLGNVKVVNGGYGEGTFSTNLEDRRL